MITTLVQFQLPTAITLEEATRRFETSAPKYQNLAGLIRKYYIRSEDGRIAGGIYLWESRRAAERVYDGEWRERVEKLYGASPTITWFDSSGHCRQSHRRHHHEGSIAMQHDDNTTRRTVLAVAAGGAAVAASGAARAQQPGAKGPLVWLDMDQQALDDAYDQMVYAPNREQVAKRRIANSDKARAVIGTPERVAYGPSEIEKLDIYRTKQANAPVNIFIHGGAWRANRAADYACLAEPFVKAGAHYVILDFTNVDDAGGSLFPMVEQVRRAVGWVYKNAESFGGDPEPALSELAFLRLSPRRLRGDARLAQGRPAGRHSQGRDCSAAACTISSRCGSRSARNTSSSPTRWRRR